jgi:hypothetical protein
MLKPIFFWPGTSREGSIHPIRPGTIFVCTVLYS